MMRKPWVIVLVVFLFLYGLAYAATYTGNTVGDLVVTTPDGSIEPVSILDDAVKEIKRAIVSALPIRSYLAGYGLVNNATDATNDIDIAVGSAMDSTNVRMLKLASAQTKQLDAVWAVGTNAGGRMSAAGIANTTYHVFAIMRVDTNVVDTGFDTSATAPTLPTNYTLYRRVGSIIRAAGVIVTFTQDGDYFQVNVPTVEWNENIAGTTAVTKTLTLVPIGINVIWHGFLGLRIPTSGTTMTILASDLATTDTTPTTVPSGLIGQVTGNAHTADIIDNGSEVQVRTNTSAQIRMRASATTGTPSWGGTTKGWWDRRGRDN